MRATPALYADYYFDSETVTRHLDAAPVLLGPPTIAFDKDAFTGESSDIGSGGSGSGGSGPGGSQLVAKFEWQAGLGFVFAGGSDATAIEIKGGEFLNGDLDKPIAAKFASTIPIDGLVVKSNGDLMSDTVVYSPASSGGSFSAWRTRRSPACSS